MKTTIKINGLDGGRVYTNEQYLSYDPFEGDTDVEYKLRKANLVILRKQMMCFGSWKSANHQVPKGERVLSVKAIVDGEWWRCVTCLPCIGKWFDEIEAYE